MTSIASAAVDAPAGALCEAESAKKSDSEAVDDTTASGGKYVQNAKAWQPLMSIEPPVEKGDAFNLHIRHKHGPLLLKSQAADGKQTERKSIWAKPASFTWTKVGPIKRSDWGEQLLIIRGSGDETVAIDAVVIAKVEPAAGAVEGPALPEGVRTDANNGALPPEGPDANAPARRVAMTIDWQADLGTAAPELFGVADYEIHDPKNAADPEYNAMLARTAPPLIRVHRANFPKQWLTADEKSWDVARIKACVEGAAVGYGKAKLMLNISSWPKWMEDERTKLIKPEHEDAYAALCVELMRIMRDEVRRPVDYWEVFNEHDGGPEKRGVYHEVLRQYTKVVKAMKAFDPSAKVGGFAFTWANPKWVKPFSEGEALAASDFVTYHNYGTGSVTDSNEKLFGTLRLFEQNARQIRTLVDANSGGRQIPIFLDEYNVKWVWNPIERRHGNAVGATFHAGVLARVAKAGINGATVWHFKGNAYGVIDAENKPRLTQPLFEWAPRLLTGRIAKVDAESDALLETLAVSRTDGTRAVLLANTSSSPIFLPPPAQWMGGTGPIKSNRVTHAGKTADQATRADESFELPGYSFAIVWQ